MAIIFIKTLIINKLGFKFYRDIKYGLFKKINFYKIITL